MKSLKTLILAATMLVPATSYAQYSTPVRDVDEPSRNSVYFKFNCVSQSCTTPYVIPAGYKLVVETVAYRITGNVTFAQRVTFLLQCGTCSGGPQDHQIAPTMIVQDAGVGYLATHSIRLYFDGSLSGSILGTNPSSADISISGYLVKK